MSSPGLDKHAEMSLEDAAEHARPYVGDGGVAVEVGDGNLNLVFKVTSSAGSVIVKQALPYARVVGSSWPLSLERVRIEAQALRLYAELAPEYVPRLLHYDKESCAIVIEDLSVGMDVMRGRMIEGAPVVGCVADVAAFASRTLMRTSRLHNGAEQHRALLRRFHNPDLCALTEDLVFTAPFRSSTSNVVEPGFEPYVSRMQASGALQSRVAELRHAFRTRCEAVMHGDLHTGSVMCSADRAKVFDPEFASPGPIAFDVGKFVANLALSQIAHVAQGALEYAEEVTAAAQLFWAAFEDGLRAQWPAAEPWRSRFEASLLRDAAGMCGVCMCRRIVGLAGVRDVRGLENPEFRWRAQVAALEGGRALLGGAEVRSFDEWWCLATEGDHRL